MAKWPEVKPTKKVFATTVRITLDSVMPCGKSIQGFGMDQTEKKAIQLAIQMIQSNAVSHLDSHGCANGRRKKK